MAAAADLATADALGGSLGGNMGELRQKLQRYANNATPEVAAEFARLFFSQLCKVLVQERPDPDNVNGTSSSSGSPHDVLVFSVRGAGPTAAATWVIEYWAGPGGAVIGQLHEGAGAEALLDSRRSPAKLVAASYQDLIDVLLQRRSPVVAITRRRIIISGDFIAAVTRLRPALASALRAMVAELPEVGEEPQLANRSMMTPSMMSNDTVSGVMWMPNDASPCCPICGLQWRPVVRQRHHCRSCGTLVCGRCSSKRPSGNRVRWCIRCAGAHLSGDRQQSFLSERSNGVASDASTFIEDPSSQTAGTIDSMPELPIGSETQGILFAHINSTSGIHLASTINAMRPSEREQRLWNRMFQAEEAAARPGHPWRLLVRRLLGNVLRFLLQVSFCLGLCRVATMSADELPVALSSVVHAVLRKLPTILPRALLGLFFVSSAVLLAMTRMLLVLTVVAIYVWSLGFEATNGDAEVAGLQADTLLYGTVLRYPLWGTMCGVIVVIVAISSRVLGRLAEIYLTAAVPISVYWSCKLVQKTFRLSDDVAQQVLYDAADSVVAPFLVERFVALGGLFVKVGQWAANVSVAVPIKVQHQLKRLTDSAPADPEAHVHACVLGEFGKPIDELFTKFDMIPIASASIAQVHRAVLRIDGVEQEVAVKLQHANVEPMMLKDLVALQRIIRFCCWLGGDKWDGTKSMFNSWARDMVYELDFGHEARNLRTVRGGIMSAGVDVVIPRPIDGWVSKRAFVMEFCRGFRFTDMDRLVLHGVDRKALGQRALQAAACQMLEIGVFNSDPHSGNLLCQERGDSAVPVLLDFGNCVRLTEAQRLAYCRLIVATAEASVTKAREALTTLNFESSQSATHPERDLEYILMVFRDTGSRASQTQARSDFINLRKQQQAADYEALGATTRKEKKKVAKEVQRFPRHVPDEFILFIRMMYLVRGLCTQMDVELPFMQIFECHARRALVSLCPRVQRAISWLPSAQTGTPAAANGHSFEALQQRIRLAIARCCAERPGLGVQVCVRMGRQRVVVDECGGMLGMVDPRPVAHNSLMPLADLSRIFPLLAVLAEVRAGRLSYSMKAGRLLNKKNEGSDAGNVCWQSTDSSNSAASEPTLKDALTHRALATRGKARAALVGSSASDVRKPDLMRERVAAALLPEVPTKAEASYLPLGAGYFASAAVEAACGKRLSIVLPQLPGAAGMEEELGLSVQSSGAAMATLSSSLFVEFRSVLASAGEGQRGGFLGGFTGSSSTTHGERAEPPGHVESAGNATPVAPKEPVESPKKAPASGLVTSALASILDSASGLLVDPALAVPAMQAAATIDRAGLTSAGVQVCPDLACASSARSLAALIASTELVAEISPAVGCEAQRDSHSAVGNLSSISSLLGLAPRAWDERGLELFVGRDSSEVAAVGLTAAHGLLGLAVQWRASAEISNPVTVAILTNNLSMSAVPLTLLSEIRDGLNLPALSILPS